MSNQIEADEIEQPVNEADNLETALCVNSNIVGDLLIGELDSWHVGICEVKTLDTEDQLVILGQNRHVVGRIDTDVWTNSVLFPDTEVKDLARSQTRSTAQSQRSTASCKVGTSTRRSFFFGLSPPTVATAL